MKKFIQFMLLFICISGILVSCQKWDDYKDYLPEGEKVYPSITTSIFSGSGNQRVLLKWPHTTDPTVTKYVIYWNSFTDSLLVNTLPKAGDTIQVYVPMSEGIQDIVIHSFDGRGNKSVPRTLPAVRSYGANYIATLFNRGLGQPAYSFRLIKNAVLLNFSIANQDDVGTTITYSGAGGNQKSLSIDNLNYRILLEDYMAKTDIFYKTNYKPGIDILSPVDGGVVSNIVYSYRNLYGASGIKKNFRANGDVIDENKISGDKQIDTTAMARVFVTDDIATSLNQAGSKMQLNLNADNTIDISGYVINPDNPISNHPTAGKSYYNIKTGDIILRYKYTNADGTYSLVEDTLVPK